MLKAFKRLWNDERGNALIIGGAALPILVGAAGLATDTIQWSLWKRELQRAADSAAIAGVYDRVRGEGATDNTEAAIDRDLELNNHVGMDLLASYPQISYPADDGDKRQQVSVTLAVQRKLAFSSLFLPTPPTIIASATAASIPGGEYCVIGLDPRPTVTGIEIGGSATLDLGECSIIANSTNPNDAATNTGNASNVKAKSLAAAGGVQYSANWNVGSYDPYSPPVKDPFANLPIPSSCDKTISVKKKDFPIDRRTEGDDGKVVCITGGLNVQGEMTLASGTYVIDGGDLTMNASGYSLSCSECTIILTNSSDPTKTGNIKLTGGEDHLTAPTADGHTYQGIALYQDRRAEDDGKKSQNHVNGGSGAGITGVIYTPNRSLLYNGGGGLTAKCMQIVGARLEFSGNSNIALSSSEACKNAGLAAVGGGSIVRLVA